jgi:hypothetical protein
MAFANTFLSRPTACRHFGEAQVTSQAAAATRNDAALEQIAGASTSIRP